MVCLKGAIGHLSGTGSMIETVIAAEFLKNGKISPTLNFEEFEGEEKINVSNKCQTISGNKILCLSAGFGGMNTAIILEKY
jgi:3-oxoacyl-(acyl-carrier-protein) synthase